MKNPLFNDGREASLEDLYSAVSTCSIDNLKEAMRCVIKKTGIVLSGSAFAAYIEGSNISVQIGSIVFSNYEIFSPLKPTSLVLAIPVSSSDKSIYLVATLQYKTAFPYPASPDPAALNPSSTIDTLSVPTITLSLENTYVASDETVLIGILTYSGGSITYSDERRSNAMSLLDPPDVAAGSPIIYLDEPSIYQLPNTISSPISSSYDTKHKATFVQLSWDIPKGLTELQYFAIDLIPIFLGNEVPEAKTSTQYFPDASQLETLGPASKAFVNMRCVPGLEYKAILYGYFSRTALSKKVLGSTTFDVAGDDISVENTLLLTVTDLVPSGASVRIDITNAGTGKLQVFIKGSADLADITLKKYLYYEGPVIPVIYSEDSDTLLLARMVDQYGVVTNTSSETSHTLTTTGEFSDIEEQLVFIVPSGATPTTATAGPVTIATFDAPYDFKITKAVYYMARNKEVPSPSDGTLADGQIRVYDPSGVLTDYDFPYVANTDSVTMIGSSVFSTTPTIDKYDEVIIKAEKDGINDITPYYGVVMLYVKKVIT